MLVDYREDTEPTVDTWEFLDQQRADAPGNPIIPPGASEITWIKLDAGPDISADAITCMNTAYRFGGNAITSPWKREDLTFLGPYGHHVNTGASEHTCEIVRPAIYNVSIPVVPGQTLTVEAQFFGQGDPLDVSFGVTWGYNAPRNVVHGPVIRAAQVREADLADATEALVVLNGDLDAATSNFTAPSGVGGIAAVAYATGHTPTGTTRIATQYELDGNGLIVPGGIKPQRWCGQFGQQRVDTEGGTAQYLAPETMLTDYAVTSPRQDIIARAGMIEDDVGASTASMGLLYV